MKMLYNESFMDDRNPTISGILSGQCKGLKWGDNNQLAIAYSYCVGGCGIVGEIMPGDEEEIRIFMEKVFEELKSFGIDTFEFSAEKPELYGKVLELFKDKEISSETEYSYRNNCLIEEDIWIQDDYKILEVDARFLEQVREGSIENSEMLTERLVNSWHDEATFLKESEACVAMHGNRMVGIIFGSGRYKEYIVVDIEVESEHRKQGIATKLTQFFIRKCVERKLIVQWDHVESNTASKALALKCGFKLFKVRPYYWFDI